MDRSPDSNTRRFKGLNNGKSLATFYKNEKELHGRTFEVSNNVLKWYVRRRLGNVEKDYNIFL